MSVPFMGPEAFGEFVHKLFRRNWPDRRADLAGPLALVVEGRNLGLENLFRMCRQDPDRAVDIVEHYFDRLLEGDALGAIPMPFAVARHRIMPRIQPESIFDQMDRELVAHVPFVNGTVIVFVIDLPHVTVSVTTEQMIRWGVQPEELEEVSRQNLARYSPDLRVQVVDSNEGGRAALVSMQDGYDATRCRPQLGEGGLPEPTRCIGRRAAHVISNDAVGQAGGPEGEVPIRLLTAAIIDIG